MGTLQRAKESVARSGRYGRGRRLSPSLAVSIVSLFISLGGVGYAAATIGSAQIKNNSVQSKDIKNSTIRSKDIRNNQVSTRDVKNGSLLSRDFKSGQLPAGARGPQGPPGARGPQGPSGPTYGALVSSSGKLVAGSALSASRSNTGVYVVRFPRSVAGCSGAANAAFFPGSEKALFRIWGALDLQKADPRDVEVQVFNDNEVNEDSSFSLMLACP